MTIRPSKGTHAISQVDLNKRNQVAVRLTTGAPIPPNAVITSATLTVTPDKTYPSYTNGVCNGWTNKKKTKCNSWVQVLEANSTPKPTTIKLFNSRNLPKFCTTATSCNTDAYNKGFMTSTVELNQSSFTANTAINIDVKNMVTSLASTTEDMSSVGFMFGNKLTSRFL